MPVRNARRDEEGGVKRTLANRYKVETRGNSFVVYDTEEFRVMEWFNSNRRASEQRKAAEDYARKLKAIIP